MRTASGLIIAATAKDRRSVISGCPVDANIFYCLLHYAPELMLLAVLALVGVTLVAMRRANHQ